MNVSFLDLKIYNELLLKTTSNSKKLGQLQKFHCMKTRQINIYFVDLKIYNELLLKETRTNSRNLGQLLICENSSLNLGIVKEYQICLMYLNFLITF